MNNTCALRLSLVRSLSRSLSLSFALSSLRLLRRPETCKSNLIGSPFVGCLYVIKIRQEYFCHLDLFFHTENQIRSMITVRVVGYLQLLHECTFCTVSCWCPRLFGVLPTIYSYYSRELG